MWRQHLHAQVLGPDTGLGVLRFALAAVLAPSTHCGKRLKDGSMSESSSTQERKTRVFYRKSFLKNKTRASKRLGLLAAAYQSIGAGPPSLCGMLCLLLSKNLQRVCC